MVFVFISMIQKLDLFSNHKIFDIKLKKIWIGNKLYLFIFPKNEILFDILK